MDDRTRLSAPGKLATAAVVAEAGTRPARPLAELAAAHGLRPSASRPPFTAYLRQLWQRRHFIVAYATARNVSMYTDARLGQLWQVLTPLLNASVYYIIFGVIFEAKRGVDHYIAFLVVGVFIFTFTERSILVGSRVMNGNLPLIRALHFPRACLPLAYVIVELEQLLLSMLVLVGIVLATGEPVTWYWLLAVPALLLQTLFNVGAALILARLGAEISDIGQLIPFLTRVWRYFCGVMYSIALLPAALPLWVKQVLALNPAAVYISVMRLAVMRSQRAEAAGTMPYNAARCALFRVKEIPSMQPYCHPIATPAQLWISAAAWALAAVVVGLVFFWQAETRYGRG